MILMLNMNYCIPKCNLGTSENFIEIDEIILPKNIFFIFSLRLCENLYFSG